MLGVNCFDVEFPFFGMSVTTNKAWDSYPFFGMSVTTKKAWNSYPRLIFDFNLKSG